MKIKTRRKKTQAHTTITHNEDSKDFYFWFYFSFFFFFSTSFGFLFSISLFSVLNAYSNMLIRICQSVLYFFFPFHSRCGCCCCSSVCARVCARDHKNCTCWQNLVRDRNRIPNGGRRDDGRQKYKSHGMCTQVTLNVWYVHDVWTWWSASNSAGRQLALYAELNICFYCSFNRPAKYIPEIIIII